MEARLAQPLLRMKGTEARRLPLLLILSSREAAYRRTATPPFLTLSSGVSRVSKGPVLSLSKGEPVLSVGASFDTRLLTQPLLRMRMGGLTQPLLRMRKGEGPLTQPLFRMRTVRGQRNGGRGATLIRAQT